MSTVGVRNYEIIQQGLIWEFPRNAKPAGCGNAGISWQPVAIHAAKLDSYVRAASACRMMMKVAYGRAIVKLAVRPPGALG
jgi:hypothetical protein